MTPAGGRVMPAARVAGAALLMSLAASAARAANCTVTVSNASANFQFNTSGDLTYGSISEVAPSISAMNCSGVTSNYLFVHSNNNISNTAGQGIAQLSGETTQSIAYRVRQVINSSKAEWGEVTGSGGNFMVIPGNGSGYSYAVDSAASPDTTFPPAGVYRDTLTVSNAGNMNNTGAPLTTTATVTITVPAQCFLPATLGTLTLNYTPRQAVTPATLPFAVSCNVPYAISLNTLTGTLLGVNYTLSLSQAGNNPRGKGRTHIITADIPDNQQLGACPQGGTCSPATATSPSTGNGQHFVSIEF